MSNWNFEEALKNYKENGYRLKTYLYRSDVEAHALHQLIACSIHKGDAIKSSDISSVEVTGKAYVYGYKSFKAFKQDDFGIGHDGDCSLIAILSCAVDNPWCRIINKDKTDVDIYNIIKKEARKLFYFPWMGVLPFFLKTLATRVFKKLGACINAKSRNCLRGMMEDDAQWVYDNISRYHRPGIISVSSANGGMYKRHSMTLIGIETISIQYACLNKSDELKTSSFTYLAVKDGYSKSTRYIPMTSIGAYANILIFA